MKRIVRNVLMGCLAACAAVPAHGAADAPLGVQEFGSAADIAAAITAFFPKVQGEVAAVRDDRVTISLGSRDGITKGTILTLWRVSKEILHPVTNAVMGRTEEEAGTIEAVNVGETSTEAVLVKKVLPPRQGDKARITPRKITLAVMPVLDDASGLAAELTAALSGTGRFSVVDAAAVASFLKERPSRDAAAVSELGRARGAEVVVALSTAPSGARQLVTAKIFYAGDGRMLDTLVGLLPPPKQSALAEVKPFFTPSKEDKTVSDVLPFHAAFLAVADLDGDGTREYAFSDNIRLHIYRQEPGGWKELWTEVIRGVSVEDIRHFSLDAADINGNGRPEVFVTAMLRKSVVSWVVEWKDGSYQRIAEVPGFLRVVRYPGRGPVLVGQEYDQISFVKGQTMEYRWSDGGYVAGPPFPLPRGVSLYGFTFADFGDRKLYLVTRDRDDKLAIYSGDNLIGKSEEHYPSSETVVLKTLTGIDAMTMEEVDPNTRQPDKRREVRIKGRMLALDINGDGRDEVILSKQEAGFYFLSSSEAELHALSWTGTRFEEVWGIRGIDGAVQDIESAREAAGGVQVLSLQRSSGGIFSRQTERVVLYRLQ